MNLIAALSARDTRGATADARDATVAGAALYAEHALGLTRLAQVMLGDRAAAEDVVHDAFCGLCRRWDHLADPRKAPAYLRSSVLNGCRSALRRQARGGGPVWTLGDEALDSAAPGADADGPLLASGDRRIVLTALRRLPHPSSYLGGVPANSSEFVCDSDPFLSANRAYILCGGYVDPARKAHPGYYPWFPTGPVTQGVGEFSVRTGKLITILGAVRAPVLTTVTEPGGLKASEDVAPLLLWASPDASVLIGEAGGHASVVRNGHRHPIPWFASITTQIGSPAPGAAW